MKMFLRMLTLSMVLSLGLLLSACGGGGGSGSGGASSGGSSGGGATTLEVSTPGENLAFEPTTLSATAGQQVTVQFKNNSSAQQHNWVLVSGGEAEAKAVADAGLTAGAGANYLPADNANVAANTPLANGGETVEASFTAPAAGTYTFLCTVPGHYPLMQGTLTVN